MLRSAAGKVAWVGRTASMVFGLALVMALMFGLASMAFAANGNNFVLGVLNNTATAVTRLTGNVDGAAMQVVNTNPGADDTALDLRVQSGEAPMRVNSDKKVANLDADTIDGKSSGTFWGGKTYDKELTFDNSASTNTFANVVCDGGDSAIGGGYEGLAATEGTVFRDVTNKQLVITPISGRPFEQYAVEWKNANNTAGFASNVKVTVHCADFPPANANAS
jgi:hypothetical protein